MHILLHKYAGHYVVDIEPEIVVSQCMNHLRPKKVYLYNVNKITTCLTV